MAARRGPWYSRPNVTARRDGRRALRRGFIPALRRAWLEERPLVTVARALSELVRADVGFVYDFDHVGAPRNVGHTFDGSGHRWSSFRNYRKIPKYARYGAADAFRNRAVDTRTLFAGDDAGLAQARSRFWGPNQVYWQLRVALYDGPLLVGMVAALRERRSGEFDEDDVASLQAASEPLHDVFATSHVLGAVQRNATLLCPVLDAFDEPAFLVSAGGSVVHANRAARSAYSELPPWVSSSVRRNAQVRPFVRAVPIELDGKTLFLVRPTGRALPAKPTSIDALPPYLGPVARRVALGLGDKEIAAELDMPLATVRTYVTRCLRGLGLTNRRQLMQAGRATQRPSRR